MLAMMVVAMIAASFIFASIASAQDIDIFGAGGGNTGFNVGTQFLAGNSNAACGPNAGVCLGGNTTAAQTQQNAVVTGQENTTCNQVLGAFGEFCGPEFFFDED